jgi:hypothetical protein
MAMESNPYRVGVPDPESELEAAEVAAFARAVGGSTRVRRTRIVAGLACSVMLALLVPILLRRATSTYKECSNETKVYAATGETYVEQRCTTRLGIGLVLRDEASEHFLHHPSIHDAP